MVKRGFRGERKRILTPSLSQGEGGMWQVIYSISPRTPEWGQARKGDKLPPLHILRYRGAHTQLSLAIFEGGM